jgi:hypothetical protein
MAESRDRFLVGVWAGFRGRCIRDFEFPIGQVELRLDVFRTDRELAIIPEAGTTDTVTATVMDM